MFALVIAPESWFFILVFHDKSTRYRYETRMTRLNTLTVMYLYTLLGQATRANNSPSDRGKGYKVWKTDEIKTVRFHYNVWDIKAIRTVDSEYKYSNENDVNPSRSSLPLFFYPLSLRPLAVLKTSLIKTKFYPIHLRKATSKFFVAYVTFRKSTCISHIS